MNFEIQFCLKTRVKKHKKTQSNGVNLREESYSVDGFKKVPIFAKKGVASVAIGVNFETLIYSR